MELTKKQITEIAENAISLHYNNNVPLEKLAKMIEKKYGFRRKDDSHIIDWTRELLLADLYYGI